MDDLGEILGIVLLVLLMLGLAFLLSGEPSVFDTLRESAIGNCTPDGEGG